MQFEALKAKRELHLRKEKEKRKLAALKAAQPEESVTSPAGSTSAAQPPHPAQNVRHTCTHIKPGPPWVLSFGSQILLMNCLKFFSYHPYSLFPLAYLQH